jgi:hypothetical protein
MGGRLGCGPAQTVSNSEKWLRALCIELFRESGMTRREGATRVPIRILDGTMVREPGKTGSQWRILYSLKLPSLICDFFDVTAVIGEGDCVSFHASSFWQM